MTKQELRDRIVKACRRVAGAETPNSATPTTA